LSEEEAEAASSSWLHRKEAWNGVVTSAEGEAAAGRRKGGDNASWPDMNFTGLKMKKIHAIDLAATNRW
jgi:hypothetical protein